MPFRTITPARPSPTATSTGRSDAADGLPWRVLDLGCGIGSSVDLFRARDPDVEWIGIDVPGSPEARFRTRADARFETFDGVSMPFAEGSFDLVYCKQVLEHVRHPEPLLAEVRRVLVPGGWFAGSTSQLETYHSLSMWNYTPVGMVALLEQAGLRAIELRPGIDGFTLIGWRLAGFHRCFHKWWERESPLNRVLNACGRLLGADIRTLNSTEAAFLRTVRLPCPARRDIDVIASQQPRAAPRDPDNLLDRLSRPSTMEAHYRHIMRREQQLLGQAPRNRRRGRAVGRSRLVSGPPPVPGTRIPSGRGRFKPGARSRRPGDRPSRRSSCRIRRQCLGCRRRRSTSSSTGWCSTTSHTRDRSRPASPRRRDLLRPGGAMVAVEPGLWHPVGLGLALANRTSAATAIHGTPDDIPLSPRQLLLDARAVGLVPELHAVTFSWRRLAPSLQRALVPVDALGSQAARCALRTHAHADRPEEALTRVPDLIRGDVVICIRPEGDEELRTRTLDSVRATIADELPVLVEAAGAELFVTTAPADVVLLEPGCVVAAGWLDGLRGAAHASSTTATATAVTQHDLDRVPALDAEGFERAAAAVLSSSPRLRPRLREPTAGCLYVRRSAIELVGWTRRLPSSLRRDGIRARRRRRRPRTRRSPLSRSSVGARRRAWAGRPEPERGSAVLSAGCRR